MKITVILVILAFYNNISAQYLGGFPSYYRGYVNQMNKANDFNCSENYFIKNKSELARKAEDIISKFQPSQVKKLKPYQSKMEALINSSNLPNNLFDLIQTWVSNKGAIETDKFPDFKTVFENYKKNHNQSLSFNTLIQLQLKEPSVFNLLTAPRHYVVNNLRNIIKYVDRTVKNMPCSGQPDCTKQESSNEKTKLQKEAVFKSSNKYEEVVQKNHFDVTTTTPTLQKKKSFSESTEFPKSVKNAIVNKTFIEPTSKNVSEENVSNNVNYPDRVAVPISDIVEEEIPVLTIEESKLPPEDQQNNESQNATLFILDHVSPFEADKEAQLLDIDRTKQIINNIQNVAFNRVVDELSTGTGSEPTDKNPHAVIHTNERSRGVLTEKTILSVPTDSSSIESQIIDLGNKIKETKLFGESILIEPANSKIGNFHNKSQIRFPEISMSIENKVQTTTKGQIEQSSTITIEEAKLQDNDLQKSTKYIENEEPPTIYNRNQNSADNISQKSNNELININAKITEKEPKKQEQIMKHANEHEINVLEVNENKTEKAARFENFENPQIYKDEFKISENSDIYFSTESTLMHFGNENDFIDLGEPINDHRPKDVNYGSDIMLENL